MKNLDNGQAKKATSVILSASLVAGGLLTGLPLDSAQAEEVQQTEYDTLAGPNQQSCTTHQLRGNATYTWSSDNNTCTAKYTCSKCRKNVSESATISRETTVTPTCESSGTVTVTASFTDTNLASQQKTETVAAIGHAYTTDYEWEYSDGYTATCTATRTCANDTSDIVTETVEAETVWDAKPTCDDYGNGTYVATFENDIFQTQEVTLIAGKLGHSYNYDYTWEENSSGEMTCTATRTCANDTSDVVTETVKASNTVLEVPTCEGEGTSKWTAEFSNDIFETQENVYKTAATGHDYTTSYTWSSDLSVCTATRVCANDTADYTEETSNTSESVVKAPTCEEDGIACRVAVFDLGCFSTQESETYTLPAKGHSYTISYNWAEDFSSCTATRTCANDTSEVVTETVASSLESVVDPTCENDGSSKYVARFSNSFFDTQETEEFTVGATSHSYHVDYKWSDDLSSCTATRTCLNDPEDGTRVIETVEAVEKTVTPPTCEEDGTAVKVATFTSDSFESQVSSEYTVNALGHNYTTEYVWNESVDSNNVTCTATRTCANDANDIVTETAEARYVVVKEPTCEENGTAKYVVNFENELFDSTRNSEEITLDAIGHNYTTAYKWSEDLATCTAARICSNDPGDLLVETTSSTLVTVVPASCTETGKSKYVANFENSTFDAQESAEFETEATGHHYVIEYKWADDYSYCEATYSCDNEDCVLSGTERTSDVTVSGSKATASFENENIPQATTSIRTSKPSSNDESDSSDSEGSSSDEVTADTTPWIEKVVNAGFDAVEGHDYSDFTSVTDSNGTTSYSFKDNTTGETIDYVTASNGATMTVSDGKSLIDITNATLSEDGTVNLPESFIVDSNTVVKFDTGDNSAQVTITVGDETTSDTVVVKIVGDLGDTADLVSKYVNVEVKDGKLLLEVTSEVEYVIVSNEETFKDVPESAWYKSAVDYVSTRGIMNGTSENTFLPNDTVTRGEMAQLLYNKCVIAGAVNTGSFVDVTSEDEYAAAADWANTHNLILGYGDEKVLGGNDALSREQAATILYRLAGSPEITSSENSALADSANVSDYARDAVAWCVQNGIIQGRNGLVDPQGATTRAEIAIMLQRFDNIVK